MVLQIKVIYCSRKLNSSGIFLLIFSRKTISSLRYLLIENSVLIYS